MKTPTSSGDKKPTKKPAKSSAEIAAKKAEAEKAAPATVRLKDQPKPTQANKGEAKTSSSFGLKGGLIAAALVVAFVGGFMAWPRVAPYLPAEWRPGADRLAELAGAFDDLAARLAQLEGTAARGQTVAALDQDLGAALKDIAAQKKTVSDQGSALEAAAGQIAAVESRGEDLAQAVATSKQDFDQRIAALAEQPRTAEGGAQPSDALMKRLAALEAALAKSLEERVAGSEIAEQNSVLLARLAAAEARLSALADAQGPTANDRGRRAALVASVGQLRAAVASGGPYAADLAAVTQLAADGKADADKDASAALAALKPGAARGVATLPTLQRQFAALAGDLARGSETGAKKGWLGRAWLRLASLVSIRRTGDVAGDSAEARVARAESALAARDLAAAVREVEELKAAAAQSAAGWLAKARAHLAALSAVDALSRRAVARLAQSGGGQ